jgi:hypothetical protein
LVEKEPPLARELRELNFSVDSSLLLQKPFELVAMLLELMAKKRKSVGGI